MDWRQAKDKLLQDKDTLDAYEKVDLGFEIGKMITDARSAKNMTQARLANIVGTKQPSIARIEKGNTLPSLSFLEKIAMAFNTRLLPPRLEFLEEMQTLKTASRTELAYPAWLPSVSYKPSGIRNKTSAFNTINKELDYANC